MITRSSVDHHGKPAGRYEFTAKELDFIINYDIKYRMWLTGETDTEREK